MKRMIMMCRIFPFTLIALSALPVYADMEALTYQDCLLNAARGGMVDSQHDIGVIKKMCEEQFPETAPQIKGQKFGDEALAKIDIWTNRQGDKAINGTIYNGNSHLVLTQLKLLITPRSSDDPVQNFFDSEEYEINLKILPYKTKKFTISADDIGFSGDFHWNLIGAWGY